MDFSIPLKNDGTTYEIKHCCEDQWQIISLVLDKLKEWTQSENKTDVQPLHMTVTGQAGTGKSTLINTITTMIKRVFQNDQCVKICAPTGCAAHCAGGVTCHRLFKLGRHSDCCMSSEKKQELMMTFQGMVAMILDERSLVAASDLGTMESTARECAFNGRHKDKPWGNIPIVLLIGDDFQLPSIEPGATFVFDLDAR